MRFALKELSPPFFLCHGLSRGGGVGGARLGRGRLIRMLLHNSGDSCKGWVGGGCGFQKGSRTWQLEVGDGGEGRTLLLGKGTTHE